MPGGGFPVFTGFISENLIYLAIAVSLVFSKFYLTGCYYKICKNPFKLAVSVLYLCYNADISLFCNKKHKLALN